MKLAIIGCGVVGEAVARFYEQKAQVVRQDPRFGQDRYEEIKDCVLAFVCVPTPTKEKQDLSAVFDVCAKLQEINFDKPVVIKSTVLPGTCELLSMKYPTLKIVHNPEFLTAKSPYSDFCLQPLVILSGRYATEVAWLVYKPFNFDVHCVDDYKYTELAKYLHNTYLATKVAYMNQFYLLCKRLELEFDTVKDLAIAQHKIGPNHTTVPGSDGLGYSGMCFPKDMKAFLEWAKDKGMLPICPIIEAADNFNQVLRAL